MLLKLQKPFHKRLALHPVSLMVVLCAGVLIVCSSFYAQAVSYDVTATVSAPAITSPATINHPQSGLHFSATPINVTGDCSAQSYVKLFRNGIFSGVDVCSPVQTYQIQTDLTPGANQLVAQVYNLTDQAGPISQTVMAYYDQPAVQPPAPIAAPQDIELWGLDTASYKAGTVPQVSTQPMVSGFAPPFSDITVTFHSNPVECKTKADSKGWWLCILASELPPGLHTVDVVAVTPSGQKMKMESFKVKVVVGLASLALPAARNLLAVAADYKYRLWRVGQLTSFAVNVSGGNGPYKASIDWGDGRTSAMPMQSDRLFNMSHTYGKQGGYNIIVRIIDSKNSLSVMQLTAQVKGSVLPVVASSGSSFFGVLFGEIRAWLWLVWPAYIALLLMVISFWIGEKQAYKAILVEKSDQTNRHGKMK